MLVILQTAFYERRRVSVVPLNVNGFKLFMQLKKNLMWEIFSMVQILTLIRSNTLVVFVGMHEHCHVKKITSDHSSLVNNFSVVGSKPFCCAAEH